MGEASAAVGGDESSRERGYAIAEMCGDSTYVCVVCVRNARGGWTQGKSSGAPPIAVYSVAAGEQEHIS